jgi:hypothetical protein
MAPCSHTSEHEDKSSQASLTESSNELDEVIEEINC